MKSIAIIALFLLVSMPLKAQVWIDSGAVWHYDYGGFSPQKGFFKYNHSQDVVIQGQLCQEIEVVDYSFLDFGNGILMFNNTLSLETRHTYVSGDTVFYLQNNQFYPLLNFGAAVGDTWIISIDSALFPNASDTSEVIVTDTDSMLVNGQYYRTISLEMNTCSEFHYSGTFVERFGLLSTSVNSLFPVIANHPCPFDSSTFSHPTEYTFKCFKDASFNLYNPSGEDCEYLLTILSNEAVSFDNWQIFPNPAKNQVQISGSNLANKELTVFSILGQLLTKTTVTSDNYSLSLDDFKAGVYFLMMEDSEEVLRLVVD